MKNFVKLLLIGTSAIYLSGCAGGKPVPGLSDKKVHVRQESPVKYNFHWYGKPYNSSTEAEKTYKKVFHKIAQVGQTKGYPYFAVVNDNFNNLSGYPINSWRAFSQLTSIYKKDHFWASFDENLADLNKPGIDIIYLKNRPKGLFVWNTANTFSSTY